MTEVAPITEFIRKTEFHPRAGQLDQDALERYVELFSAGRMPDPVIVQRGTLVVVQGWHRIEAAQRAGIDSLPFQAIDVADDDIRYTAYQMDRDSAVPITREQRNRMIIAENNRFTQDQLADRYGLTQPAIWYILNGAVTSNINTYITSNHEDRRKKVEAADVVAEWRLNPDATQQAIADKLDISRQRVGQILSDFKAQIIGSYESGKLKLEVAGEFSLPLEMVDWILRGADHEPINFEPKLFNIWNFGGLDRRYGQDHPGRLPAGILQNLLYYYTRPGDHIVDLMAGGGTTIDVAADMVGRTCDGYDIDPKRPDVQQWDVFDGMPSTVGGAQLVFLDPPYWKQKRGEYSGHDHNLANLSLGDFYEAMEQVFGMVAEVLPQNSCIAVIVGLTQEEGRIYDHAHEFSIMLDRDYLFANRVIVPYSTQQAQPFHVEQAKKGRYMLKLYRDLLIYRRR